MTTYIVLILLAITFMVVTTYMRKRNIKNSYEQALRHIFACNATWPMRLNQIEKMLTVGGLYVNEYPPLELDWNDKVMCMTITPQMASGRFISESHCKLYSRINRIIYDHDLSKHPELKEELIRATSILNKLRYDIITVRPNLEDSLACMQHK